MPQLLNTGDLLHKCDEMNKRSRMTINQRDQQGDGGERREIDETEEKLGINLEERENNEPKAKYVEEEKVKRREETEGREKEEKDKREIKEESRPTEKMGRGQRMKEVRERLKGMRQKTDYRETDGEKDVRGKREPLIWRGKRLQRARDTVTEKIQDRGKPMLIVGSDVEALYPSLEAAQVAELVYKAIMKSQVKFENVDYREAVRYIAMNWDEQTCRTSLLARVLPRRRSKQGVRPGVTGVGPMGPDGSDCEMWRFPRVCLTELEKRRIVATVVQIGVMVMFTTHVYQFGGKYYLQKAGGPIGLRSTCAVARLTMLEWDKKWLASGHDEGQQPGDGGQWPLHGRPKGLFLWPQKWLEMV